MKDFVTRLLSASLLLLMAVVVQAQTESVPDRIRSVLNASQPGMVIADVAASPVNGMYMVTLENLQTIFVTEDARFFIPGDLFELAESGNGLINRVEEMRSSMRLDLIAQVPEEEMIIFPAEGETLATMSVFTDVDCPYCRQLHGEIEELNAMGITVRYLGFPREGLNTPTYDTMVSTWCADDRNLFFTVATRGGDVPEATCETPIARHYQLGRNVGVEGTPALVFEDGTIVNGYIPAETLGQYLLPAENN